RRTNRVARRQAYQERTGGPTQGWLIGENAVSPTVFHATTVLCVRQDDQVAIAGDGQVTIGNAVAKADAVKVRKLPNVVANNHGVLVGFAGSAADAFALMERFEAKLKDSPSNLTKAAIELAKHWRMDKALRQLDSLLIVADRAATLMISGQ